jgi:signal transduction histidine kinase
LIAALLYNYWEAEMGSKKKPAQHVVTGIGLDIPLQDILNGVEDSIVVVDSEHRVRFANSEALNKLGPESSIGKLCYQVLQNRDSPCGPPLWDCPLSRVLEGGATTTVIHPIHTAGTDTYLKITAYPLRDSGGNIKAIVEFRRDVTAERELESQLLRRHHQLSALSHISSAVSGLQKLDTILRIALDNVLELVDSDIGGILLLDEETKTLYYRVQRGLSAKYAEESRIPLGEGVTGNAAQVGEPMVVEDISKDPRVARPDLVHEEGLRGFVSIPLKTKDKVIGVMNIASHVPKRFGADDVSLLSSIGDYLGTAIEQARLYDRLARASERYQALLQHALTAQEQERKRIARELHDETSQAITSLTLNLQALAGMAEMKGIGDAEFLKTLRTTHSYAVHAGNEIVKLMKELRPTLLDELGMPAAIHRYAKDTLQAKGINLSADFTGTDQRFPPEVEVTLFRVAQGAIGNILEHSEAKNASIKLECNATECTLRIEDDGKGFDVSKITRVDPSGRGAGVFTMKERVGLVSGNCHIESRPGRGTKVVVRVPLAGGEPYEEDKGANSR